MVRLAVFVAVLFLLVAAGLGVAADDGVLRISDTLDVTTLNPFLATSDNLAAISQFTMGYLVERDADGRLVPALATEVPTAQNGGISADGRTLVYHLRRGVRFSDGVPFTADDVVFTAAVVRNPGNNTIIGGSATWQDVASVTKRDPWTVVVRLKRPDIEVPATLLASDSLSAILPRHAFASTTINTAPYNGMPVGLGPFRYTAFRRGEAVEMEPNPYWYGPRPKLRRIVYKIIPDYTTAINELQTGELDLLAGINGADITRVSALPGVLLSRHLNFFVSGLFLNVTAPPTDDVVVRRALRLATDRPALFDRIVHRNGALTESVIPKIFPDAADLPVVPFDPARAAALLDADGWKVGADGIRMKVGIRLTIDVASTSGYQPALQTVELMREDWKRAGIELQSHVYGPGMYFAMASQGGILELGKFNGALFSTEIASL